MKSLIKKTFILILLLAWFLPTISFAANMFLGAEKNNFAKNEDFLVQVFIDTKDASVNAVQGSVLFPAPLLELKEIRDGNSSINFWVERPHDAGSGQIVFSGITTGGFSGSKIFLFGLVFQSKEIGNGLIALNDLQVLQNDGLGTKISTTETSFAFSVSKESGDSAPALLKVVDTDPPENFYPFITSDSSMFDGKYFLVFSTVDKGTGIDHYEVRESFSGWDGKYITAESPYLLKDQTLKSKIYIKAIDKAGNERIVKLGTQNRLAWFLQGLVFVILLIVCVFVFKKIWSKFTPLK
jgi:hypothetical protein